MAINRAIEPPKYGRWNATYDVSLIDQAPASANYILAAINCSATSGVVLRRLIVWNTGAMTAPQKTTLEVVRLTAASSGGAAFTPQPYDVGNVAGATVLTGNPTVTAAATPLFRFSVYTPAAVGTFVPLDLMVAEDPQYRQTFYVPSGTANGLALRVANGAAGAAGFDCTMIFTEENF